MRLKIPNRLIAGLGIAAMAVCASAATAGANPPPDQKQHQQHAQPKPKPKAAAQKAKPAPQNQKPKPAPQHSKPAPPPARPPQPHGNQAQARPAQPPVAQAKPQAPQQAQRRPAAPVQHAQPARPGGAPAALRPESTAQRARLAPRQQQVLISEQQQRITQYRADLGDARRAAEQQSVELQHQHRTAQYRFTQSYVTRLRQQETALQEYRYYDYDSDPYFYTPADYRYYRGDRYYETNEYGIALLRTALNNGYREGWLAGTADREDGWQPSYGSCYAYRDANYGYNGYYLDRGTYNYYFREGFRRGYEDGYARSYRYGRYSNGTRSLLGSVLNVVLRIEHIA